MKGRLKGRIKGRLKGRVKGRIDRLSFSSHVRAANPRTRASRFSGHAQKVADRHSMAQTNRQRRSGAFFCFIGLSTELTFEIKGSTRLF